MDSDTLNVENPPLHKIEKPLILNFFHKSSLKKWHSTKREGMIITKKWRKECVQFSCLKHKLYMHLKLIASIKLAKDLLYVQMNHEQDISHPPSFSRAPRRYIIPFHHISMSQEKLLPVCAHVYECHWVVRFKICIT